MDFNLLHNLPLLVSDVHPFSPGLCFSGRYVCLARVPQAGYLRNLREDTVKRSSQIALAERATNCAEQLARFFPGVVAVRIPVQTTALRSGAKLREATVLEFGGAEHAIFLSTLPLEFDDHVRLQRNGPASVAEATVVAVQYHEGRKAVAVKFALGRCDWMTRP
jgi:hypothetical protein